MKNVSFKLIGIFYRIHSPHGKNMYITVHFLWSKYLQLKNHIFCHRTYKFWWKLYVSLHFLSGIISNTFSLATKRFWEFLFFFSNLHIFRRWKWWCNPNWMLTLIFWVMRRHVWCLCKQYIRTFEALHQIRDYSIFLMICIFFSENDGIIRFWQRYVFWPRVD